MGRGEAVSIWGPGEKVLKWGWGGARQSQYGGGARQSQYGAGRGNSQYGRVIPVTLKLALQWLPCPAPGVIRSALGLVSPVTVTG